MSVMRTPVILTRYYLLKAIETQSAIAGALSSGSSLPEISDSGDDMHIIITTYFITCTIIGESIRSL